MQRGKARAQWLLAGLGAWAVLLGAAEVRAAPRSVAVLNAAADQEAGARLSAHVRAALQAREALRPLPPGELARALEQPLGPDTELLRVLQGADGALVQAEREMGRLRHDSALAVLAWAEERLVARATAAEVVAMLGRVTFLRGVILARDGKPAQALAELRAARRLDPGRPELDPVRYPPELVALHRRAGEVEPGAATLRVVAPFDGAEVIIDGRRVGVTPVEIELSPGVHYVAGEHVRTGSSGERVVLAPGEQGVVRLALEHLSLDERARLVRRALLERAPLVAQTRADAEQAAWQVKQLSDADVVIVLADDAAGELSLAFFQGSALGPWRLVGALDAEALLAPLEVRARPQPDAGTPEPAPVPVAPAAPPRSTRPWLVAALATSGAAVAVGLAAHFLRAEPALVTGSTCCDVASGRRAR